MSYGKAGDGQCYAPTTKYPAEGATVKPNGGNDAIHDHVKTSGPSTTSTGNNIAKAKGK
jgi:hypothetical protein